MKKYLIVLFIGLFLLYVKNPAPAADQTGTSIPETWTAERAVAFAIKNSPDSTVARKRIEQAMAIATMAQSTDYPLVTLATEYSQTDNPMYSFGNILNQGAFTNTIDFNNPGRTDNLRLAAQLNYRLYDGGRDQAEQAAKDAYVTISQSDLLGVKHQLAFEVVKTFQALIQAEEMVSVRNQALHAITVAMEVGRARFEAGDLLRQDLLNLELQRSIASENLIQSKHILELTRRGFLNLLGLKEGDVTIDPTGGAQQEIPSSKDYSNRHELKKLDNIEQEALAELKKAESGKLPSVDLFAGYQIDSGFVQSETGDSWMAGIRMNYILFDGKKTSLQIANAKLKIQEIRAIREKTELALDLELQQALLDYQQAKERLTVTAKMVGFAEEVSRLGRAQFNEGVILASELIDFEMRLSDAQARQLSATANYQVAIANLRRAAGLEQFPKEKEGKGDL